MLRGNLISSAVDSNVGRLMESRAAEVLLVLIAIATLALAVVQVHRRFGERIIRAMSKAQVSEVVLIVAIITLGMVAVARSVVAPGETLIVNTIVTIIGGIVGSSGTLVIQRVRRARRTK